ncbi:pseudouridine synthase [Bacteroides nordii]|uniref:pseudouridine synthase n=1 Tax=Bacteroides nordii TaxID=291645 RepID=UPI00241F0040|nr:pseudouridine synthase [Bacteroides nordii]MBD9108781.1 pseudouridine synthase [Bacteroides nordii]
MSTENEEWRDNSNEENTGAGRDGNRSYNREGGYNRPSYNNREGGDRPYRPRFNSNGEGSDRPQRSYGDRPQRPSYNREGGDRPYRPRFNNNNEGGDRPQRSYGDRPAYGDRPQRPSYNNNRDGGDRPYRPRFNNNNEGGDRPQRSYGDRPQRPSYNREGGDRPYRPRFNNGGEGRPQGFARPQRRTGDYDPNAKYSKKKQIEYKEQFVDPNEPIRLNKFLANAGVCSRREADEFITAGVVSVNGEVVTELGTKIKRADVVKFHDETVSIERKVYVLLNKPKDCVTTSDDPQARLTVMDLVKGACSERIYPVGRLDRNTTGVLLLTNDGDLASKLTHPKFLKKKIYHVYLDKNLTKADMDQIAAGVELEDGEIHADAISYADDIKRDQVGIEIHSGKNRIVRRIFESLGYKVVKLDRVFFAGLTKKGLRRGEWRYLTEQEVNFLRMGSFE